MAYISSVRFRDIAVMALMSVVDANSRYPSASAAILYVTMLRPRGLERNKGGL